MAAVSAFLSKLMKQLQKKLKLFMEIEKIKRFTQNVTIPYVFSIFLKIWANKRIVKKSLPGGNSEQSNQLYTRNPPEPRQPITISCTLATLQNLGSQSQSFVHSRPSSTQAANHNQLHTRNPPEPRHPITISCTLATSVVDPDPHGSGTLARIRN